MVPAGSPMRESAEIQAALELDALGRNDDATTRMREIVAAHPNDRGRMERARQPAAFGQGLFRRRRFLRQGDRAGRRAEPQQLDAVLFPRHLLRAVEAMAEGGSRLQEGARALSRPAAGAQLSRLFLGRPGRQSRRGVQDAAPRGRSEAERRLHRRQSRLGALQARPLPGGDRGAGKGDRPQAGRSGRQRSPRRRLLARQPPHRSAFPVEPRARHEAGDRGLCRRSSTRSTHGLPDEPSAAAAAPAARRAAARVRRRTAAARLGERLAAALARPGQGQSDPAGARRVASTAGTNSTASSPSPAAATNWRSSRRKCSA